MAESANLPAKATQKVSPKDSRLAIQYSLKKDNSKEEPHGRY